MKKFSLYTLALCLGVLTIFSCKEKDRAFPEYGDDDVKTGAYPRLVEGIFGDLDYENPNNPDSSSLSFIVEFYDQNQGKDVASYSWSAKYGDNFGPTVVKTYTTSDFTNNADGLPQLSATITFDEIFNALGMTINDFDLTVDFLLDATLTMNDGRTFSFSNTGTNVVGQPTFQGLFRYVPAVTKKPCNSILEGDFTAETKATNQMAGIGWDDCDGASWSGSVRFEAEHDAATFDAGSYVAYSINDNGVELEDGSMGVFYTCYTGTLTDDTGAAMPLGDLRITESCGKLGFFGASQWGEVYSFVSVEVDGATLTLGWTNDYGEGGVAELTRTDGNAWQPDLFCEGC